MSNLTSDRWLALSSYLDKALDMSYPERTEWLGSVRAHNPTLAEELEVLLHDHDTLSQDNFLERHSVEFPGPTSLTGHSVGAYRLISQIGQGGMSTVWLGERDDGRFDRRVAVKFLNFALIGNGGEKRFKREGKILGLLIHPGIAGLIDAGVLPTGQPYLVLEFVDGDHIDRYCDQRNLDVLSRIRMFMDVIGAVAKAHANLIVHRDLKPSNVLVRADGQVKLLDFGIAKLLEGEGGGGSRTQVTLESGQALTPQYAAPEQLKGQPVTTATDVYSLGVLLYVLLTGRHPSGCDLQSPADLMKAILDEEPRRVSDIVAHGQGNEMATEGLAAQRSSTPDRLSRILRGDLDTIVAKALKKEPTERYPSVTAMADDLRRYLRSEPIGARPDTTRYRAIKFVRRNITAVALAGLAVTISTAGMIATMVEVKSTRTERDLALRQLARAERIAGLNELLLTDAAPMGKPLTPNRLLDREEQIVEREHYDDAANHIELLLSIGDQYSGQDNNADALRVLGQAYVLSRLIKDKSVKGKASCVMAGALVPTGELARAEALFQEGLDGIPRGAQFALDRSSCLVRGSEIAYRNGNSIKAIERAEASNRVLQESPIRSDDQELGVLVNLAGVYGDGGHFQQANATFARASTLLTSLGYDETNKAVKLFNDWALVLTYAGRQLEAEKIYRRAIDIGRVNPEEDAVLPVLLYNYGGVLRDLGRLGEAEDYTDRAAAQALKSGDSILVEQAALQSARICRDRHDWTGAHTHLAQVEPKLRSTLPPGHYAFASLASDKALLALAEGDLPDALRLASQAVAIDEVSIRTGGPGAAYLPTLLVRRSSVELELRERDRASEDVDRALNLLRKSIDPNASSSNVGRAYLAHARVLLSQGRYKEANADFVVAHEHLRETLGENHPDTLLALQSVELSASNR